MLNSYRIEGDSVYIKFRFKKHNGLETVVSLPDLERLLGMNCSIYPKRSRHDDVYAVLFLIDSKKSVLLHRFILDAPRNKVVDHINHNTLDNRRENLRSVTQVENTQNMGRVRSDNKSGYRGVVYKKRSNKWLAYGYLNGKRYELGYYETPEQASEVASNWRAIYQPSSPDARELKNPIVPEIKQNKTSGITGISWLTLRNRWVVQLYKDKKSYFGGSYKDLEDAKIALEKLKAKLGRTG